MLKGSAWTAAAFLALNTLTACDDGTPETNVTKIAVMEKNPFHERMLTLREVDRKLALRRAIQDDGGTCRSINGSAFQQIYQGMAMWVAYCSTGDWAVYVAPSGVVQVRDCKQAAELGLPVCAPSADKPAGGPIWNKDSKPLPPPNTR